ncbi:centrosomal protein of 120 kDa-like [Asterias rubens]|uniref:centrosomal protein of 120 kDa-like n=1 Tax=Asterias rubens TaxID=7604 RepID=UPI0014558846|nr:centrosomal protein of 120 kDa-like [Asterias rubens]
MVTKEKFLVVVSILEGRKFPKRSHHQLLIETRFDGELLATDPVSHGETPELCTELAWELSKKALHQHRLQRTPIKLVCYALDTSTNARESIGYVMLDLRTAILQEASPAKVPVTSKWYPLLNSKYNRHKPQLKVGVALEADTQAKDESFRAKAAPPRSAMGLPEDEVSQHEIPPSSLKPILNDAEGCYQIGPPDSCTESFVLSVTIAYAANLAQLVPSSIPLPSRDKGFFFFYSLFGNDVTNEPFHDLLNPSFTAERASVRLRSSVHALQMMFAREPALSIHLCCGDQSLGSCEVPWSSMLRPNSDAINRQPLIIEGSFHLNPPLQVRGVLPPGDNTACVGASVVLRREEIPIQPVIPKVPPTYGTAQPTRTPPHTPPQITTPPKPPMAVQGKGKKPSEEAAAPQCLNSPAGSQDSYTMPTDSSRTDADIGSIKEEEAKTRDKKDGPRQTTAAQDARRLPDPRTQPQQQPVRDETSTSTTQPHVMIEALAHHFSMSIDLRSVKNIETTTNLNIYLRYLYPFFGSVSPILTHPPIEVRRHTEVLLPHSFCSFNLAATVQQLQETLLRVPLLVEVWHRDRMTKDQLLGVARVSLAGVLRAEKARIVHPSGTGAEGTRQIHSESVTAETTSDGKPNRLAELHVVLGLEDYGPIRAQQVVLGSEATSSSSTHPVLHHQARQPPPQPPSPEQVPAPDPRETAEYKAALELEMWKEQHVRSFESQLKDKELQHLRSLTEEWKRKDREREALVVKKLEEHSRLEDQLRHAFADIEKREQQLAANESEVMRLRTDLQREQERQVTEMREVSRRMKEDHISQMEIEKSKVRLLEEEKQHLSKLLSQSQTQLQEKDREFQTFRDQLNNKPEIRLQSDLSLLTLEKVELERKLESVTKSKIHYKQQWGRALKELARLKQREQSEAKARLKREQQELEHMRLRYLAAEEKEVVKSERQQLDEIKGELNRLKQQEVDKEQKAHQQQTPSPRETNPEHKENTQPQGVGHIDPGIEAHVARLIEERDTLLRTGVYTHQDRIISELDRQIRESIAQGHVV